MRIGYVGLPQHAPGVPGDERDEARKRDEAQEIERDPDPGPDADINRVDADVRAAEQRRREAPGAGDGKGIAGELIGAVERLRDRVAQGDVDADDERGKQQQRPADDRADPGYAFGDSLQAPHARPLPLPVRSRSLRQARERRTPATDV